MTDPGIHQMDLLKTWTDEAREAIEAKKLGNIVDLWKVVAERQVRTHCPFLHSLHHAQVSSNLLI